MKVHQYRIHVTVPYNFTDYTDLTKQVRLLWLAKDKKTLTCAYQGIMLYLNEWAKNNQQANPLLLCYTKGSELIVVNKPF